MTTEHARTKQRAGTEGLAAAWAVLVGMGGTSATYNVWHAVHSGALNIVLALLYGLAPVLAAAALSHIVAVYDSSKVMRCVTFLVMLGAMALSIGATASVVKPAAGSWMQWLFGAVIDAASLVALRVILGSRSRKYEAAAEIEAAHAEAQTALATARTTAAERARLGEELATARSGAEAELAAAKAELGAELERIGEAHAAELQALTSALNKALNRRPSSPPKRATSSLRNKAAASPMKPDVPSDVDTQAEALRILAQEPDISGGELGLRLGKSKRYGCMLKNRLAGHVAGPEEGPERS
jgi:hypothetical protein